MGLKLDMLIKDINKKNKEDIAFVGSSLPEYTERIPFSSYNLNLLLKGGLRTHGFVEFSGEEGSGKTTTTLDIIANAQKVYEQEYKDGLVDCERTIVYVDAENTLDPKWATMIGVDMSKMILIIPQEQTAEQVFDMMQQIIETGECGLIVLDSVATLVSQSIYDQSYEQKAYAGISTALTRFCNTNVGKLKKNRCLCIMINQMRDNLSSMYGGTKTTGGRGFKHHCMARLQFRKGKFIDENGKEIPGNSGFVAGNIVHCHVEKNKISKSNYRLGSYTLYYDTGIDVVGDIIDFCLTVGIIEQKGAFYTIGDLNGEVILLPDGKKSAQGKKKLKDYILSDKDLYNKVMEVINTYEKQEENN